MVTKERIKKVRSQLKALGWELHQMQDVVSKEIYDQMGLILKTSLVMYYTPGSPGFVVLSDKMMEKDRFDYEYHRDFSFNYYLNHGFFFNPPYPKYDGTDKREIPKFWRWYGSVSGNNMVDDLFYQMCQFEDDIQFMREGYSNLINKLEKK